MPADIELTHRLREGITLCQKTMKAFRDTRKTLIERYVGSNYGDKGAPGKRPINNIALTVTTLVPLLASDDPRMTLIPDAEGMDADFYRWELATNRVLSRQLQTGEMLRRLIVSAVFGPAVARIGTGPGGQEISGIDLGKPFVDEISLDDWLFDPSARAWESLRWCGNRYEMDLKFIRESGMFSNTDGIQEYEPDTKGGSTRDMTVSRDPSGRLTATGELMDIYYPPGNPIGGQQAMIVTYAAREGQGDKPLRLVEYQGPEYGPYKLLSFAHVPDSVIPLAPAYSWEEMDEAINAVVNKWIRQAKRQKDLLLYSRNAQSDAEQVKAASDGDTLGVADPKNFSAVSFGGASDDNYAFLQTAQLVFSRISRNADQAGGIQSNKQATATEISTLQANADVYIDDMQRRVYGVAKWIGEHVADYTATNADPTGIPIEITQPGVSVSIKDTFRASDLPEGALDLMQCEVVPYSLQRRSPEMLARNLMAWLNTIAPMAPLAQAAGMNLDVAKISEDLGQMLHLPHPTQYWVSALPPEMAMNPDGGMPAQAVLQGGGMPQAGGMPTGGGQMPQKPQKPAQGKPAMAGGMTR